MATQTIVVVPSRNRGLLVACGERVQQYKDAEEIFRGLEFLSGREQEVDAWIEEQEESHRNAILRRLELFYSLQGKEVVLIGVMGGVGQSIFIGAADMGIPTLRIPMFRLQEITEVAPRASAQKRAKALEAAWISMADMFYPITPVAPSIAMARQLARERLAVQDLRKPMQLRFYNALREMRYLLPLAAVRVLDLIEKTAKDSFHNRRLQTQTEDEIQKLEGMLPPEDAHRILAITRHYASPGFILGARNDEEFLEHEIIAQLGSLPIWRATHPDGNSSLPQIKGFAAVIGGTTIAEIADILRFPGSHQLRSYARFGLKDGAFPRRVAGRPSSWNPYLYRVLWLWGTDQVMRYDHPWKLLLEWKKAREMLAHPEPMPREITDRHGRKAIIYDYTLSHIHKRAARWTGSQLLKYLWHLWQQVAKGNNPEEWYVRSSWPAYFAQAEQALAGGLQAYLDTEIPKRRRQQPKEEEEEEEEEEDGE